MGAVWERGRVYVQEGRLDLRLKRASDGKWVSRGTGLRVGQEAEAEQLLEATLRETHSVAVGDTVSRAKRERRRAKVNNVRKLFHVQPIPDTDTAADKASDMADTAHVTTDKEGDIPDVSDHVRLVSADIAFTEWEIADALYPFEWRTGDLMTTPPERWFSVQEIDSALFRAFGVQDANTYVASHNGRTAGARKDCRGPIEPFPCTADGGGSHHR